VTDWPETFAELIAVQEALAEEHPERWEPSADASVAGCFVCFDCDDPGGAGDQAWAAAATRGETATATGAAQGAYKPGLLALRAGPVLEQAVRNLKHPPDVLIADATGRDHPRRAGLALHLGARLGIPTIGVTHRTLRAHGDWPQPERGAHSPLVLDGEVVGAWLRVQPTARPIAVHAAWCTDARTAVEIVMRVASKVRTPEPLRAARRAARLQRARATS
jgi:deoxyribonuclease V